MKRKNTIQQAKQDLREIMLEERRKLSDSARKMSEQRISNKLIALIEERSIKVVHTYLPMGKELNHIPFIDHCLQTNMIVVTSKTLKHSKLKHLILSDLNQLENGVFGTKHPKNAEEWTRTYDLIVVPGLAFDQLGNRLGYGGGYYDSFLSQHPKSIKVGVAFPFQIVYEVMVTNQDQKVDFILS
ncbi:MAG: 5-formyltetrahydrofolate cyclo-ligase [Cyclobacteriaceae bacterium]